MHISQKASIYGMIVIYNNVKAKEFVNPCLQGKYLTKIEKKDSRMINRHYKSLVESVLYIANDTMNEILFAVGQLNRHLE